MTDLRTDDDLERLLRSTLLTAADTVTSGPAQSPADGEELLPARPHRRWLAPVAAAAAAALIAGLVVAQQQGRHSSTPPTTELPTTVQSTSSTPPRPADVRRTACSVSLPLAWSASGRAALASTPTTSDTPLAVLPDGEAVVARDTVTGNRVVRRVIAYVEADGTSRDMYTVPSPSAEQLISAQVEGDTVLVQVRYDYSTADRVIELASRIIVIDPGLGVVNVRLVPGVAGHHPGNYIDGAAMLDGHVYYDERDGAHSEHGRVYDFDLDRFPQPARVIFTGMVGAPRLFGGGIGWDPRSSTVAVARTVPAPVARETATQPLDRAPAITDGVAWAWKDDDEGIAWYRTGQPGPVHVRLGHDSDVLAVAGDYVVWTFKTGTYVTDMRTGATAPLTGIGAVASSDGVILSAAYARNGNQVAVRLDTKALPALTC